MLKTYFVTNRGETFHLVISSAILVHFVATALVAHGGVKSCMYIYTYVYVQIGST